MPTHIDSSENIINKIKSNPFNQGVIFSGLEWTLQIDELNEMCAQAKKKDLKTILFIGNQLENIKKLKLNINNLDFFSKGDLIDLRAAETIKFNRKEYKLIPLGVGMILPEGYKACIYPRSSTYKNFGIISANSVGQIDNSYSGNDDQWQFPAIALRETVIRKGDRIAQFEIQKIQPDLEFEEVENLYGENRGGIGSSGIK